MVEPVTATVAVVCIVDRATDRVARARQRRRLMRLAETFRPGTEVGERYGRTAGWYVRTLAGPEAEDRR
jgi:phosphosulfolactate phosphohydrolase-like enzyme